MKKVLLGLTALYFAPVALRRLGNWWIQR